jgi:hypothetical protein
MDSVIGEHDFHTLKNRPIAPNVLRQKIVFPKTAAGRKSANDVETTGAARTAAARVFKAAAWWSWRETESYPEASDGYLLWEALSLSTAWRDDVVRDR